MCKKSLGVLYSDGHRGTSITNSQMNSRGVHLPLDGENKVAGEARGVFI
jgi:hypothetical protein